MAPTALVPPTTAPARDSGSRQVDDPTTCAQLAACRTRATSMRRGARDPREGGFDNSLGARRRGRRRLSWARGEGYARRPHVRARRRTARRGCASTWPTSSRQKAELLARPRSRRGRTVARQENGVPRYAHEELDRSRISRGATVFRANADDLARGLVTNVQEVNWDMAARADPAASCRPHGDAAPERARRSTRSSTRHNITGNQPVLESLRHLCRAARS